MDWNCIRIPVSRSLWISRLFSRLACAVLPALLVPARPGKYCGVRHGHPDVWGLRGKRPGHTSTSTTPPTPSRCTLLNLQLNPSDVDQAIGSLRFTLTGAGTPPQRNTHRHQRYPARHHQQWNPLPRCRPRPSTVWQTSASAQSTGWQVALCAVCAAGGTNGLIIGGPNATHQREIRGRRYHA